MNKSSILTIALIFSGLMMTACTASERTAGEKGAASEAEQAKSKTSENKSAENKSDENKKPAEKTVLYDFRKTGNSKPQTFPKAETDAVLKYLLESDSWDKDLAITSRVQGAFTKPNAKETLYFVTGCKDGGKFVSNATCGHAGWNSAGWIATFDGTTPILKIEESLGAIEKATDVNGDGKNEFLSVGSYGQSGIYTATVTLGQISGGKYEAIKSASASYGWNCAFGAEKKDSELSARASVISYIPTNDGKMPEFTKEYYQGQCKNGEVDESSWKVTSEKDFNEFLDSIS